MSEPVLCKGPIFIDGCGHNLSDYVASFVVKETPDDLVASAFDLYIFQNGDEQEVCIRYGNSAEQYISPGQLSTYDCPFMRGHEPHKTALEILSARANQ